MVLWSPSADSSSIYESNTWIYGSSICGQFFDLEIVFQSTDQTPSTYKTW